MYLIIDVSVIQTTAEKLFVSSEATKLLSGGGGGCNFSAVSQCCVYCKVIPPLARSTHCGDVSKDKLKLFEVKSKNGRSFAH